MSIEQNQQALIEIRKSKEFIRLNWADSIANEYLIWVEQAEEKLNKFGQRREVMGQTLYEIQAVCQKAIEDTDGPPKTLKRVRTYN